MTSFSDTTLSTAPSQSILNSSADSLTVNELQQVRTQLLIREAQLSQAQRMAGMASWEWYFHETQIRWSPEMYLFWGYQPNEVTVDLDSVAQSTHTDDLPILQAAVEKALQGDDLEMQYRRRDKAGREIFIHTIGRILRNEAGEAIGVFGVDMNITKQKEQERKLRELNEALERQNEQLEQRNAELGSFAHAASHDLQEPLRKIKSFNELILENEADRLSEQGREFFRRSANAAERMQLLIRDLIDYSRINATDWIVEQVDLGDLIEDVEADLQEAIATSGAVLNVDHLPTVTVIRFMFRQLLQNLIANALKFHQPGQPPVVTVSYRHVPDANEHELIVADRGIGFSPLYKERIFQLFQRLHKQAEYPGTGIGLAICQRVMQNHGGSIEANSQPGAGATFIMRWPVR